MKAGWRHECWSWNIFTLKCWTSIRDLNGGLIKAVLWSAKVRSTLIWFHGGEINHRSPVGLWKAFDARSISDRRASELDDCSLINLSLGFKYSVVFILVKNARILVLPGRGFKKRFGEDSRFLSGQLGSIFNSLYSAYTLKWKLLVIKCCYNLNMHRILLVFYLLFFWSSLRCHKIVTAYKDI